MKGSANRATAEGAPNSSQTERARSSAAGSATSRVILLLLAVLIVATVVIWGISSRRDTNAQLLQETHELAIPTVIVIHPQLGAPQQEIVLPGNMQPYSDAPIYARTNGYLKSWTADIGARVKAGQLLAEIDTPEVDQQLQQAQADLKTAQANEHLAETTASRYQDLMKTDSVSKQDVDNATGSLAALRATVASGESHVKQLEDMQSFEKIYAPFAGVITARNTDVGMLIDSGASGGAPRELFHIAAVDRLRTYINVPEIYSPFIKDGMHADLTLPEYPGRHFDGTMVRNSGAIDATMRTLLTEVDVNNSAGELKPGSYVEVHLKLPSSATTFTVPVSAVIFKSAGMQLATVKDGKTIALIPITPGRDFGNSIEVLAGLKGGESVVVNPPDSIIDGETIRLADSQPAGGGKP